MRTPAETAEHMIQTRGGLEKARIWAHLHHQETVGEVARAYWLEVARILDQRQA